ncbi:MAG: 3-deoxy-D-manno-octulosonic acid transferase, partial [Muribaculaceae bacterium]
MNWLYNTAIRLYACAAKLAAIKSHKISKMIKGQKETLDYLTRTLDRMDMPIWVHAASLGEFEQARTLIELIKAHDPEQKIVLTFFSPSGYEVRKNYDKVDAVAYLPFDTEDNANDFLNLLRPKMAIF